MAGQAGLFTCIQVTIYFPLEVQLALKKTQQKPIYYYAFTANAIEHWVQVYLLYTVSISINTTYVALI